MNEMKVDIMREMKEGFANICQQMRATDGSISQPTESQGDIVHASISASRAARVNLSSMQMENIPQLLQAFTINMGQKMSAMSCIMGWYTAIPNAYFECYPRDEPVTIYVTFVIDKKILKKESYVFIQTLLSLTGSSTSPPLPSSLSTLALFAAGLTTPFVCSGIPVQYSTHVSALNPPSLPFPSFPFGIQSISEQH